MRHTGYRSVGRLAALCSLLLLIAAGAAVSAHAAPPRASSPALPSSASPQGSGNLTTGGGHIQQRPVSYVIFWGAAWSASGSLTGDGQIAVNYLSDVGQTGYEKIVSQYYDSSAYISATHTLTPDWIDTTNPATDTTCGAQTVQDTAIQNEVSHAIAVNGWPADGANATYYVYTPTGYSVNDGAGNCSETQFCSYHNWSSSLSVAYAVIPYPNDMTACGVLSSPNGNAAGDSLANLTAQAQAGSITDPNAASGWADSQGNEASAKCAWDFSNGTTTLNNGGVFELQSQYSNASQSCVTNLPTTGDSVGVFHPSLTIFGLRNTNTSGSANTSIVYGSSTDYPIAGDWNGDGIDTVGVYHSATGQFFLTDINASGMPVTHAFTFGSPGDIPIVGDWAGLGHDSVGVFHPSNGVIYLRNALSTGFSDYAMVFGSPGDIPIAGDWSGQGRDSIGIFHPQTDVFYLTNTNCNCIPTANYAIAFGSPGDRPFVGDWTHSGKTGVGVFHPSTGAMYLKNDATIGGGADFSFSYGSGNDVPVAGHWY